MRRILERRSVFLALVLVVVAETIGWALAPWQHHPATRWASLSRGGLPLGPGRSQLRAIVYEVDGTLRVEEYVELCNITSANDMIPPAGVRRATAHWDEFGTSFGLWAPMFEVFRHNLGVWPETGPALTPTEVTDIRSQCTTILRKRAWLASVAPPGFAERFERGDGTLVVWHGPWIAHDLFVLTMAGLGVVSGGLSLAANVRLRRRRRREERGLCPWCGYDRCGMVGAPCPECGRPAENALGGAH